jgi:hypothetical protein
MGPMKHRQRPLFSSRTFGGFFLVCPFPTIGWTPPFPLNKRSLPFNNSICLSSARNNSNVLSDTFSSLCPLWMPLQYSASLRAVSSDEARRIFDANTPCICTTGPLLLGERLFCFRATSLQPGHSRADLQDLPWITQRMH